MISETQVLPLSLFRSRSSSLSRPLEMRAASGLMTLVSGMAGRKGERVVGAPSPWVRALVPADGSGAGRPSRIASSILTPSLSNPPPLKENENISGCSG